MDNPYSRISSHLTDYISSKSPQRKPKHVRAYYIQLICDDIFVQKDFRKILGQTKDLEIDEIKEIYESAKNWKKNPQALFWKLLREKKDQNKKG